MPQKLIRLTSDTGDGVFNGIFNQEIEIKEDSEIALQSLSLERLSASVKITSDNNSVAFASVDATESPVGVFEPNQIGTIIPSGIYDKSNVEGFFGIISNAMNKVCNAFITTLEERWGIQHNVYQDVSGKVAVGANLSPFYQIQKWQPPDYYNDGIGDMSFLRHGEAYNGSIPNNQRVVIWGEFQTGEYGMWRGDDTTTGGGGTEPEFNEAYIFGNEAITKSTGAFRTRFKRLNTDGAGTAGFTMGLVKGDEGLLKAKNASLKLEDFSYAIRVNGHATPIQYINKAGSTSADFTSSVTPVNHTTAAWRDQLNDVLDIRVGQGEIYGHITSQADAVATPIKTRLNGMVDYEVGADYYWVICLHEGKDKVVLDLVGVTLDPFGKNGGNRETSVNPFNAFDQSITTGFSAITDLPVQPQYQLVAGFTPDVTFNEIVSKYLGFPTPKLVGVEILEPATMIPNGVDGLPDPGLAYYLDKGYYWLADVGFDNTYDSDTYIIDTQTFTLDSYDSYGLSAGERSANSGGSRRNIIATIPVSETTLSGTTNSIIQYEPATQNYIKIRNRGNVVTRQIRCRLLSGMYQPIKTEGLASIVLLIKE